VYQLPSPERFAKANAFQVRHADRGAGFAGSRDVKTCEDDRLDVLPTLDNPHTGRCETGAPEPAQAEFTAVRAYEPPANADCAGMAIPGSRRIVARRAARPATGQQDRRDDER
jgi:hypothetical protein